MIVDIKKLKFNSSKILTYNNVQIAILVLEYNGIKLSSNERYRCSTLHDFRVQSINILKKDNVSSQIIFDMDEVSKFIHYSTSNKLLSWNLEIYIVPHKKSVALIWKHKNNETVVHGLCDIDILENTRIDVERLTPKFRPNVSKFYIEHKQIPLHRILLTPRIDEDVDHVNLITTDNRYENIRVVTNRENILNRGVFKNSNSGIKGVMTEFNPDKSVKRFRAEIVVKGRRICKSFSVCKYGYDDALKMAIRQREIWNEKFNYRSSTKDNR